MWKVHLSRWINHRIFFGRPDQMLSSRLYEENRLIARSLVDCLFFILRGEREHCKKKAQWETAPTQDETQPTSPCPDGLASLPQKGGGL